MAKAKTVKKTSSKAVKKKSSKKTSKKKAVKKIEAGSVPAFVDKRELARFFQVTTRQVERWGRDGCPAMDNGDKNLYDLKVVFDWHLSKTKEKSMNLLDMEKLRETKAKADIKEMEVEEKLGNYLPLDEIIHAWQTILSGVKSSFTALPSELKTFDPKIDNKIVKFLKKRVNEILKELSSENPHPEKPKKTSKKNSPSS